MIESSPALLASVCDKLWPVGDRDRIASVKRFQFRIDLKSLSRFSDSFFLFSCFFLFQKWFIFWIFEILNE